MKKLLAYLGEVWLIALELSPYLMLGLLIAGILDVFVQRSFVEKHLGKGNLLSTFKAALLGVPLPLCSCGVIPTGISFHNHGASKSSTVSFLISTPQTGVDSVLVTYSMMNWPWSIFRPLIAFLSGVFGGWLIGKIDPESKPIQNKNSSKADEIKEPASFKKFFNYAFNSFLSDISRPLIGGIFIAAAITLFMPESVFSKYLDYPNLNMIIILVASVPLYVCATGSVPIGAALLAKGLSPGAVLVFLMAGPATNAATITVLWNTLGKKTTTLYVIIISVFALFFGYLMNTWLPVSWFSYMPGMTTHQHQHLIPEIVQYICVGILLVALINIESKKLKALFMKKNTTQDGTYQIDGMTCNHCKAAVERAIGEVENVEKVEISLELGTATITGPAQSDKIKTAVENVGYIFKG